MKGIRSLLRVFSYLFHALVVTVAVGVAAVILLSGAQTVNFDLLPLAGNALAYGLLGLALCGAIVLLLAVRHKAQALYVAWTILVLLLVVRFLFFSSYGYVPGSSDFTSALYILAASILAVLGARQKPGLDTR